MNDKKFVFDTTTLKNYKMKVVEKDVDLKAFDAWFDDRFGKLDSTLTKRIAFLAWDASRNYHLTGDVNCIPK